MTLDGVVTVMAVIETGSIQAAAQQLRVSRATVRRRVEELEMQLGVGLVARTRAGAKPTPAGEFLADNSRGLLAHTDRVLAALREFQKAPQGRVVVAIRPGLLPEPLAALHQMALMRWPELSLELRFVDDPVAALRGPVHIAVDFEDGEPEFGYDTLALRSIPFGLLASSRYLQQAGDVHTPDDLAERELLLFADRGGEPHTLPTRNGQLLPVTPRVVSNHLLHLRHLSQRGVGIAYVPNDNFSGQADDLVPVLPDQIGEHRTLQLVVPSIMTAHPEVQQMWEAALSLVPGNR